MIPQGAGPLYLDSPEAVERFVSSISTTRELALDTEGASFHRFVDRIYLLQLSTREQSAIIDPLPIGTPASLGKLLESRDVEVVFHDADYDLRLLQQDYGWRVTRMFDTRVAAQLLGLRAFGLAALLERYFGVKLDKKHQRADWSLRPLTPGMLDYAAQDTRYLLDLRDRMRAELSTKGRLPWAEEEFARLEGTRWASEDAGTGFLKLKGARDLARRELAVLRELVRWRDDTARAADRATFRIIGNEVLLDMARVQPATQPELAGIKGVPRGIFEHRSEELLDAVRRGASVPEADLPRFPRGARWDKDPAFDARVAALKTVRDAAAHRLDIEPGVLCSRDRMEAVARRNPGSLDELAEVDELRKWQAGELGAEFVRALRKVEPAATPARRDAQTAAAKRSPYRDE
ncbi:MAG: ribonuclease D [Gemmatimonadaceae bacterium]